MKPDEIIDELRNVVFFPEGAILAAREKKDDVIPLLLREMESFKHALASEDSEADDHSWLFIFACFLLAEFREKTAYRPLVDIFFEHGDEILEITGDFVTENLGQVLASVFDGDRSLLEKLIETDSVNEYVRSQSLDALVVLVNEGVLTRNSVIDYFRELFIKRLPRKMDYAWASLVCSAMDLHPGELMGHIRQAFSDNLIDEFTVSLEAVEEDARQDLEDTLAKLKDEKSRFHFIRDTLAETRCWACFQEGKNDQRYHEPQYIPPREPEKIIGRNDPCPCNSGKKYKKCCGK